MALHSFPLISAMLLADGLVVFAKRACPTCALIEPLMRDLAQKNGAFRVVSQDDPQFPKGLTNVVDDRELEPLRDGERVDGRGVDDHLGDSPVIDVRSDAHEAAA